MKKIIQIILIISFLIESNTVCALDNQFTLITRDQYIEDIFLIEITDNTISVQDEFGAAKKYAIKDCVGVVNPSIDLDYPYGRRRSSTGLLVLTDGQHFPGQPKIQSSERENSVLLWQHRLGAGPNLNLEIDLESIAWARIGSEINPPDADESDAVLLSNGDLIEGFVKSITDPLTIESDGNDIKVDLEKVSAVRLVNPPVQQRKDSHRLWLLTGTIIDVGGLLLGDDGILRFTLPMTENNQPSSINMAQIAGILFDATALTPLAEIEAHDVVGPPSRYIVTPPHKMEGNAALGLASIEMHGPVTARYRLPARAERFMASFKLHPSAGAWADCQVIVKDDDREVFMANLSQAKPETSVNVEMHGSELTIEITEGLHGPIQDYIVIEEAMILSYNSR